MTFYSGVANAFPGNPVLLSSSSRYIPSTRYSYAVARPRGHGNGLASGFLGKGNDLLQHKLSSAASQFLDIFSRQPGSRYGVQNFHGNPASVEDETLDVQNVGIVCYDHRNYRYTGLCGQVEGSFLERQQLGLLGVATGAFGKHVDTLLPPLNLLGGTSHGVSRVLGTLPIDEDGPTQGHEPTQKRHTLQIFLGRDTAIFGEHAPQHQDVEFSLMISDKDGWANCLEVLVRIFDLEGNACREGHDILEGTTGSPLGQLFLTEDSQDYRGNSAVYSAYYQGDVGGERTSDEGRLGHDGGQHVEGHDKTSVTREKVSQNRSKRHVIDPWEV